MKKFLWFIGTVIALGIVGQILTVTAAPYPPALGGTGTSQVPTSGQLPIGNGAGTYTPALLTPGTDIVITNASGSVTIAVNATQFLPSSTVYVASVNGQNGVVTITSSTLGVATNTLSLFNGNGFTTTTIQSVLNDLSATGLLTYNSSTGAFGYTSSSLALGSASHSNSSDFLASSTVYVTTVNGQSGAVTLGIPATSTITASGTILTGPGFTFGSSTTITPYVSGTAVYWKLASLNISQFTNDSGYITSTPATSSINGALGPLFNFVASSTSNVLTFSSSTSGGSSTIKFLLQLSSYLTAALQSLNGATSSAQTIVGGTGASVSTVAGASNSTTTVTNTGVTSFTGQGCVTAANSTGTVSLAVTCISGNQSITFTMAGDATGTASGATAITDSITVTGLNGHALPALSTGTLEYSGGAWKIDLATSSLGVYDVNGNLSSYIGSSCGGGQYVTGISATGTVACGNPSGAVTSFNTQTGAATYTVNAGSGLSVTTSTTSSTLTLNLNNGSVQNCTNQGVTGISATGTIVCTADVFSIGGVSTGTITLSAGTGISISTTTNSITISGSGGSGTVTTSTALTSGSITLNTGTSTIGNSSLSQSGGTTLVNGTTPVLDGGGDYIGPNIYMGPTTTALLGNSIFGGGVAYYTTSTNLTGAQFCAGGFIPVLVSNSTATIKFPDVPTIASSSCGANIYAGDFSPQFIENLASSTANLTVAASGTQEFITYSPGTPTSLTPGQIWEATGQFGNTSTLPIGATSSILNINLTLYQSSTLSNTFVYANSAGDFVATSTPTGLVSYNVICASGCTSATTTNSASITVTAGGLSGNGTTTYLPVYTASNTFAGYAQFIYTSSTQTVNVPNVNGIEYASQYPGSDIGAQINNAIASSTSNNPEIMVTASASFSTTINIGSASKLPLLVCAAGVNLTYTGSGSSTISNGQLGANALWGIEGCTFTGTNNAGTGLVVGGNLGSNNETIYATKWTKFNLGISALANVNWLYFDSNVVNFNNQDFLWTGGANSGEGLQLTRDLFADNSTITSSSLALCVDFSGSSASLYSAGDHFDDCGFTVSTAGIQSASMVEDYWENPEASASSGYPGYAYYTSGASASGQYNFYGGQMKNDAQGATSTPSAPLVVGDTTNVDGLQFVRNGNQKWTNLIDDSSNNANVTVKDVLPQNSPESGSFMIGPSGAKSDWYPLLVSDDNQTEIEAWDTNASTPAYLDNSNGGSAYFSSNVEGDNVQNNSASYAWRMAFSQSSDSFSIQRSPATSTWNPTTLFTISNAGVGSLAGAFNASGTITTNGVQVSTSTASSLAGPYLGTSGTNSLTVSSTLASSTWSLNIANATTTASTTNYASIRSPEARTITGLFCYDSAAATTTLNIFIPKSFATTTVSSTINGNFACGINGNSTTLSTSIAASSYVDVEVSSTAGTPVSTFLYIDTTKL